MHAGRSVFRRSGDYGDHLVGKYERQGTHAGMLTPGHFPRRAGTRLSSLFALAHLPASHTRHGAILVDGLVLDRP
ncbi:MAG TPA: hypothetical protein P5114_05885, partial [Hyphomicrobiaceae bacterium]|nr:hypothetical protein [Hyphomicrobiaceae bacterium]